MGTRENHQKSRRVNIKLTNPFGTVAAAAENRFATEAPRDVAKRRTTVYTRLAVTCGHTVKTGAPHASDASHSHGGPCEAAALRAYRS